MRINVVLILVFVTILLIGYCLYNPPHESFQILGAAGNYQDQYAQCINACGKEDPSSSFSSPNNLMCGVYCDYIISNMAGAGIPPTLVPTSSHQSICEQECEIEGMKKGGAAASHNSIRKCVSSCSSQKEITSWCAELWCPYSLYPNELCMNMCTSSNGAKSNSNSWKWGRYG